MVVMSFYLGLEFKEPLIQSSLFWMCRVYKWKSLSSIRSRVGSEIAILFRSHTAYGRQFFHYSSKLYWRNCQWSNAMLIWLGNANCRNARATREPKNLNSNTLVGSRWCKSATRTQWTTTRETSGLNALSCTSWLYELNSNFLCTLIWSILRSRDSHASRHSWQNESWK